MRIINPLIEIFMHEHVRLCPKCAAEMKLVKTARGISNDLVCTECGYDIEEDLWHGKEYGLDSDGTWLDIDFDDPNAKWNDPDDPKWDEEPDPDDIGEYYDDEDYYT